MCSAAVSAARDAFVRVELLNNQRSKAGLDTLSFGIALHAGTVIYGNVGTEKRLGFTATGPSVGLVSRCEAMTKELGVNIVGTGAFVHYNDEGAEPLGEKELRGFADPVRLFAFKWQTKIIFLRG